MSTASSRSRPRCSPSPRPKGARDYLVPVRVYIRASSTPCRSLRSTTSSCSCCPACDRYIQIARCFRDEDLRADRQPEFTQIDLEMSFVEQDDVIAVNEGFLQRVFKEVLDVDIQLPLPRMTWQDAMDKLRLGQAGHPLRL